MSSADLLEADAPPQPEEKKSEGKEPRRIKRWMNGALGVIGMDAKSIQKRQLKAKVDRLFARVSEVVAQLGQTGANGELDFERETKLDTKLGELLDELNQALDRLLVLEGENLEETIAELDAMLEANSTNDEAIERLVADLEDVQYQPGDRGNGGGGTPTDFDAEANALWDQTQREADEAGVPSADAMTVQIEEQLRREKNN